MEKYPSRTATFIVTKMSVLPKFSYRCKPIPAVVPGGVGLVWVRGPEGWGGGGTWRTPGLKGQSSTASSALYMRKRRDRAARRLGWDLT